MDDLTKKYLTRTSVRSYHKQTLTPEQKQEFIDIINASPTSNNAHSFSAIILEDADILDGLVQRTSQIRDQSFLKNAAMVVVFCADFNRSLYAGQKKNVVIANQELDNFLMATGDAFIAGSFLVTSAFQKGYGTLFLGSVRNAQDYVKEKLCLEKHIMPVFAVAIGKPARIEEVKPKLNKVFVNHYDLKQVHQTVDKYDETFAQYLNTRTTNNRLADWSDGVVQAFAANARLEKRSADLNKIWFTNNKYGIK